MSLTIASQVIGFISFSITLATLLGVYSDLIKVLRSAPAIIPLALGNFREELQYEQFYIQRRIKNVDEYDVFSDSKTHHSRRKRREFNDLIEQLLHHLWTEFCDLERPFIVQGESPWVLTVDDDDGNVHHVFSNEGKVATTRRRRSARQSQRRDSFKRSRMGVIEAGLSSDRSTYYRTDFPARFLWWWKSGDVKNLADGIQRVQIRRIERDVYESNELIKRGYRMNCKLHGWNLKGNDSSDDDSGSSRHGGGSDDGRGPDGTSGGRKTHRPTSTRHRHMRKRSDVVTYSAPEERQYPEREIFRTRPRSPDRNTPSEPGPRRSSRARPASVVYEVVTPGRVYVDVGRSRDDRNWRRERSRSYSRGRE